MFLLEILVDFTRIIEASALEKVCAGDALSGKPGER